MVFIEKHRFLVAIYLFIETRLRKITSANAVASFMIARGKKHLSLHVDPHDMYKDVKRIHTVLQFLIIVVKLKNAICLHSYNKLIACKSNL